MIYYFDGSFIGLLTAVFDYFERKSDNPSLKLLSSKQISFFENGIDVVNDVVKSDRVWKGLQSKLKKEWIRKFYCAFLSENPEAFNALFKFCIITFTNKKTWEINYGNPDVIYISKMAKSVEREKHRMEAFIRFKLSSDGVYFAVIDPDFNVLPLIINHFKNRYADQKWIIYDVKRNYGLHYDLQTVEEFIMSNEDLKKLNKPSAEMINSNENIYAVLWKNYFKSTNIVARKNTKLHLQHVPKRYWKYLTEK